MRVLLGLVAWSLVEIALFVTVGSWVGVLGTLLIVLGSGVAGVAILRRQGTRLGQTVRANMGAMRDPMTPVAHSGLIGLAAVLLILPGFLTDMIGLALLVPPVRRGIIAWVGMTLRAARVAQPSGYQGDVVEAVAIEVKRDGPHEPSGWTKP